MCDKIIFACKSEDMPACRNGRLGRLKICCGQPRMGSSPIAGSKKAEIFRKKRRILAFFVFKCAPLRSAGESTFQKGLSSATEMLKYLFAITDFFHSK